MYMIRTSFAIMSLFFRRVCVTFSTLLPTLNDTVYQWCKIPYLDFRAHHKRYTETLNKLRLRMRRFRPDRNTTDVLLLHDNARPQISLRTWGTRGTFLPHPAHSPDLAHFKYRLFGPVRDALRGRHFADDNELKQSFSDALRSRGREFCNTGTKLLTQRWQNVLKMEIL
jgi:hypothetical protein